MCYKVLDRYIIMLCYFREDFDYYTTLVHHRKDPGNEFEYLLEYILV